MLFSTVVAWSFFATNTMIAQTVTINTRGSVEECSLLGTDWKAPVSLNQFWMMTLVLCWQSYFWNGKVRRYLNIQLDNCPLFCLISCSTNTGTVVFALPLGCLAVSRLELTCCPQGYSAPSMLGLFLPVKVWTCKASYSVNSRDYFATKCIAMWRFHVGNFLDNSTCYCTK